jgi:hypothetical protein
MTSEEILKTEYSEEFDEIRKKAMVMGHYKYGAIKDNIQNTDMIGSIKMRIAKYEATGNTEYMADIANFAMIEFMCPRHPRAHFKYTDSDQSPGLYGMSTKEAERFKEQNEY